MSTVLTIGNKRLSSWSLRPWILMRHFNIDFDEFVIRLDEADTRATIKSRTPSGAVPALKDGDVDVWDSLAIAEYLADKFPEKNLWPEDRLARARARCLVSEMHSGFSTLRQVWPMDFGTENAGVFIALGVRKDVNRILDLWVSARKEFGAATGEPYLFGEFSIADAFYAPVVSRFKTYGPFDMPEEAAAYMEAMWQNPAMQAWKEGVQQEFDQGWY